MKKESSKSFQEEDEMLPEYDLRGKLVVRGKYYEAYQKGAMVQIENKDGSVTIKPLDIAYRAVVLDPDVRAYFPDSESVNTTLRSLISLVPNSKRSRTTRVKSRPTKKIHP